MREEWKDFIDGYFIGDLSHNDMYRKAKRSKKTVINLKETDLETDSKVVMHVVHPIYSKEQVFWGAVVWELDLWDTLDQFALPLTIEKHKYPFVQLIYPESPLSGQDGEVMYFKISDDLLVNAERNQTFRQWKAKQHQDLF